MSQRSVILMIGMIHHSMVQVNLAPTLNGFLEFVESFSFVDLQLLVSEYSDYNVIIAHI